MDLADNKYTWCLIVRWRAIDDTIFKHIHLVGSTQRYTEITHDPLLFSVRARNNLTVHRETLAQYITLLVYYIV